MLIVVFVSFFTLNDQECTRSMTFEAVYDTNIHTDIHFYRQIIGYCKNILAGDVRVGIHVVKCYGVADCNSVWNSVF